MAPKCSAQVLSSVAKCKKAVMYLSEKIQLCNCCSDMKCSAIGHEVNVNESIIYIKQGLFKQSPHEIMDSSADENVMTKGLPEPNHVLFPLGTTVPSLLMQCS